ncbi:hypothetical protein D9M72_421880 [compost metagenome]
MSCVTTLSRIWTPGPSALIRSVYSISSNQMKYSTRGRPYLAMERRGISTETNEQLVISTARWPLAISRPQSHVAPALFISQIEPSV